MVESPSGGEPKKSPGWDITRTEACGGGKEFCVCPMVYGEYLGIYGAEIRVRGVTRNPHGRGACPTPWARPPPWAHPPASWAPRSSTDVLLPPIYTYVSPYDQGGAKNLIPPPQPSVSTRSQLGACSGAPLEGASTTEGFYINTIAPPMKCE